MCLWPQSQQNAWEYKTQSYGFALDFLEYVYWLLLNDPTNMLYRCWRFLVEMLPITFTLMARYVLISMLSICWVNCSFSSNVIQGIFVFCCIHFIAFDNKAAVWDLLHNSRKQSCICVKEIDYFPFAAPILGWPSVPAHCLYCSQGVLVRSPHGTIIRELYVVRVCVFIHILCKYIKHVKKYLWQNTALRQPHRLCWKTVLFCPGRDSLSLLQTGRSLPISPCVAYKWAKSWENCFRHTQSDQRLYHSLLR